MLKNFTKGLVIGGIIGASIGVITNSDIMDPHMRKKMVKSGRKLMRRSNHVIGDMIDLFR